MSWSEEKQSAWLYRQAAQAETDQRISKLFVMLADAAEHQAAIWKPHTEDTFVPGIRARIVAMLLRKFPPRRLRPILAAMKLRGLSAYDISIPGHVMPTSFSQVGKRHARHGGGNLRAAVFGVNDGLVSNACLIMGVAGAQADNQIIITTGIAGLLAGALSMAAGEYISIRSQREMFEYQIGLEREELAEYPAEEAEELALIYQARGMELNRAREFATELMRNPDNALDILSREELGLNPGDLGSPWGAAISSFISFSVGACVPVLPFLFGLISSTALAWSATAAAVSLFIVGMTLSLFTGRSAVFSGLRMLLIGSGAGLITFLIGHLFGASLN